MKRTHSGDAGDDAVAQRASLVRAPVVGGEETVACTELSRGAEIEDREYAIADRYRSALPRWNLIAGGNSHPVLVRRSLMRRRKPDTTNGFGHVNTLSRTSSEANCVGSVGAWPSSHASRARAFDFAKRSRSRDVRRSRRSARDSWHSHGSTGRTAPRRRAPARWSRPW